MNLNEEFKIEIFSKQDSVPVLGLQDNTESDNHKRT